MRAACLINIGVSDLPGAKLPAEQLARSRHDLNRIAETTKRIVQSEQECLPLLALLQRLFRQFAFGNVDDDADIAFRQPRRLRPLSVCPAPVASAPAPPPEALAPLDLDLPPTRRRRPDRCCHLLAAVRMHRRGPSLE